MIFQIVRFDCSLQYNYDKEQFWKHACFPEAWNTDCAFSSTISGTDSNLNFKFRQKNFPVFLGYMEDDFAYSE